jgi:asparagine N-glycosylation enzyme membrane subunit Stt3
MFRHLVGRHGQMSRVSMSLIVLLGAAVGVVASRLLGVNEWVLSLLVGAVFGALTSGIVSYVFLHLLERDLQRKDPWKGR